MVALHWRDRDSDLGSSSQDFIEKLRQEQLHRIPPFARILSVELKLF
jgi:hypothetical protein